MTTVKTSSLTLKRISESSKIKEFLNACLENASDSRTPIDQLVAKNVEASNWTPTWAIAIAGSKREVPVNNGFPLAEVAFVNIASVMLDIKKMHELDKNRPVDPAQFSKIKEVTPDNHVIPGCNVVFKGQKDARSSLRKQLFDIFSTIETVGKTETLLETYEALLAYKQEDPDPSKRQKCPIQGCDKLFSKNAGQFKCPCKQEDLYSTDALRIHEGLDPTGSNGALFTEVRQVLERIWFIHILRSLEKHEQDLLSTLGEVAFIIDGPLAVFGHPAWLKDALSKELIRINQKVRTKTGKDILLLGVENTGVFWEHLHLLDKKSTGEPDNIDPGKVMLLTDEYIKKNIVYSTGQKIYGEQTYFGRKFLYKTASRALIVGNLPFLKEEDKDLSKNDPSLFPRLSDALSLLDELVSLRYPNSILPVVEANMEVAIPLDTSYKILEKLARELVGNG